MDPTMLLAYLASDSPTSTTMVKMECEREEVMFMAVAPVERFFLPACITWSISVQMHDHIEISKAHDNENRHHVTGTAQSIGREMRSTAQYNGNGRRCR
jgi:hypothetical protein